MVIRSIVWLIILLVFLTLDGVYIHKSAKMGEFESLQFLSVIMLMAAIVLRVMILYEALN